MNKLSDFISLSCNSKNDMNDDEDMQDSNKECINLLEILIRLQIFRHD